MKIAKVLALVSILGLAAAAWAEGEATSKPVRPRGLRGKVVKVDGANVVVKTWARQGEGKDVTVVTDDKTVVTLDEKEAKVADLKADMYVLVTPAEGTAEKIVATTKAPERPKRDKPAAHE